MSEHQAAIVEIAKRLDAAEAALLLCGSAAGQDDMRALVEMLCSQISALTIRVDALERGVATGR